MTVKFFRPFPTCSLGLFGDSAWQSEVAEAMASRKDWLIECFESDPRFFVPQAPSSIRVFVFIGPLDSPLWPSLVQEWLPCFRQLGMQVVFVGIESRWPRQTPDRTRWTQQIRRGGGLMLNMPHLGDQIDGPRKRRFKTFLRMLTLTLEHLSPWSLERLQEVLSEGWGCRWFIGESPLSALSALEEAKVTKLEGLEPAHILASLAAPPEMDAELEFLELYDSLQNSFYRNTRIQAALVNQSSTDLTVMALLWP